MERRGNDNHGPRRHERLWPSIAEMPAQSAPRQQNIGLISIAVFCVAFLFLFLGMDRTCEVYDEGLVLVGAMRVAAGNVIHRDFYANYGPAEFYILAWLFKLFGPSVLVERIFDLSIKAGIVTACFAWPAIYCRKSIAILTSLVCFMWLFSFTLYGSLMMPVLLLSLVSSGFLFSAYFSRRSSWRIVAAGAVTGLTALFRYDIGFGVLVAHLSFIAIAALTGNGSVGPSVRGAVRSASQYIAGTAIVFVPPALMYLAVAPVQAFIFDIITYPSKYYARARGLPFPGVHLFYLDDLAVYLPIVVIGILLLIFLMSRYFLSQRYLTFPASFSFSREIALFFVLFGLLNLVFYIKGLVRVGAFGMLASIAYSLVILAVLLDRARSYTSALRYLVAFTVLFAMITATWLALKTAIRLLKVQHSTVLAELLSPPGPAAISGLTSWCGTPNPLHSGLCFLVDTDHIKAIRYIDSHTSPKDQLFVGLPRHDKIWANDILTYFATQRMPATKWYHFDPDLQTRADIQDEMIREIESRPVPYILLDSEFDNVHEPNDSSKSSGVSLLDDFIRRNYQKVQSFGELSVWQRKYQQDLISGHP